MFPKRTVNTGEAKKIRLKSDSESENGNSESFGKVKALREATKEGSCKKMNSWYRLQKILLSL